MSNFSIQCYFYNNSISNPLPVAFDMCFIFFFSVQAPLGVSGSSLAGYFFGIPPQCYLGMHHKRTLKKVILEGLISSGGEEHGSLQRGRIPILVPKLLARKKAGLPTKGCGLWCLLGMVLIERGFDYVVDMNFPGTT